VSQPARVSPVSRSRWEALEVLVRVERVRAFADLALLAALARASLDPRDAALASELVYGTLRWRRYLDWRLAPHSARPLATLDPWVRALLRLTAYQVLLLDRVPAFAAVDEAVSLARHKGRHRGPADYVNAVLRSLTRSPGPPPLPADLVEALGTRLSFPDWIVGRWLDRRGPAEAEALMTALNERPPTTVRVNALRASREELVRRLRDEELADARPTGLAPEGVRVDRGAIARSRAFADGWCTVQDEASMLVARLLAPRPGEVIADACAAPGTKATHLAELMEDRGRVIAMAPPGGRLKLAGEAARRLHLRAVELHPGPVAAVAPRWRERCAGALVDAPCSNLGVLRRNPEVKWRRGDADLARLAETQRQIIAAAASMVESGGRLVYATCSLEPEENEAVVAGFLAAHPEWAPATPPDFPVAPDAGGFVHCLPHVHGTDGFTAILLKRRPGGR
jgi:16S rRNA (cytosine967-C5)-methyltransferase